MQRREIEMMFVMIDVATVDKAVAQRQMRRELLARGEIEAHARKGLGAGLREVVGQIID